jgi:hypothetical protein
LRNFLLWIIYLHTHTTPTPAKVAVVGGKMTSFQGDFSAQGGAHLLPLLFPWYQHHDLQPIFMLRGDFRILEVKGEPTT